MTDFPAFIRVVPAPILTLSGFVNPDRIWTGLQGSGLIKGLRISIAVQNLFNG